MERVTRVIKGQIADAHGAEGKQEKIITNVEAPDTPGVERDVIKVVRPGGVDDMWARGRITDRQRNAADRFISTYEAAHSDGVKGIDYSKLKVDCMAGGDAFMGDRQIRAVKELEWIERGVVGRKGYRFLVEVLCEGASIAGVSQRIISESSKKLGTTYVHGYVSQRISRRGSCADKESTAQRGSRRRTPCPNPDVVPERRTLICTRSLPRRGSSSPLAR